MPPHSTHSRPPMPVAKIGRPPMGLHAQAEVKAKDKAAGVPVVKDRETGRFVAIYEPKVAMQILERLADGQLLKEICALPGMPHKDTFRRWVVNNPELGRAYEAAIRLSAVSLEEDALQAAREVKAKSRKMSGTDVRAYEVAMNQFRWSAARRDPAKFGERAPQNITVPIQINTSLDLGAKTEQENIYTITAKVPSKEDPRLLEDRQLVPDPKPFDPRAPRKSVLTPRIKDDHQADQGEPKDGV